MLHEVMGAISGAISVSGFIPYIVSILKGRTKTTVSTWFAWALLNATALAGMIAEGEFSFQVTGFVLGNSSIAVASILQRGRNALGGWSRLDFICLGGVIAGILLWLFTNSPVVAIVVSILAMAIGAVPMIKNIWVNPLDEALLPWAIFALGGFFAVLAIENWTIAGASVPVYFFATQLVMCGLIARKFLSKYQTV